MCELTTFYHHHRRLIHRNAQLDLPNIFHKSVEKHSETLTLASTDFASPSRRPIEWNRIISWCKMYAPQPGKSFFSWFYSVQSRAKLVSPKCTSLVCNTKQWSAQTTNSSIDRQLSLYIADVSSGYSEVRWYAKFSTQRTLVDRN